VALAQRILNYGYNIYKTHKENENRVTIFRAGKYSGIKFYQKKTTVTAKGAVSEMSR